MIEAEKQNLISTMRNHKICVLVPTYNNAGTLRNVISEILNFSADVIVVNDGSTDDTQQILSSFGNDIILVKYDQNRGKGYALKCGFKKALELGFEYAITLDSDGQHYASDLCKFVVAVVEHPGALIVGQRDLTTVDINGKSSFANKFSNFWYRVQTGRNLKDTQTGYRAYPLKRLYGLNLLTSRYEAELELLVFAAWNGVDVISIPINVYYPPQSERVSHFKPALDFTRISILNTILCFGAILYGLPVRFFSCIKQKKLFNKDITLFTRKKGEKRDAALTFDRIIRSVYGGIHFLFWALVIFKPFSYFYFHVGQDSDAKKMRFHKALQWMSSFFAKRFPGTKFVCENTSGETFEQPSLIICNHQSQLDLPIVMSLTPKLIILTNDWVWNNKYFGNIVHYADFLPVSAGMSEILPKLKCLTQKGYSIMIFPEGTRSADCTLQRFHQGAFLLAQELKLDVVPMVLHGAGNYMAKHDLLFRSGNITLRILPRVSYDKYKDLLLRKQASMFRKLINDEFEQMKVSFETPEYFKSLVLYRYAYRGWNVVSRCKNILRQMPNYMHSLKCQEEQGAKVYFINSGIGVVPLLYALTNKHVEVYGLEENIYDYTVAIQTPSLPTNLHFVHPIYNADYEQIESESRVFVIGDSNYMTKFEKYNPTLIRIRK
jgi:1-acyl-sn-glycerol-3-phosphate acyltransferase